MRFITVKEFSILLKVRLPRAYELARRLPPGIRVELGRQLRINEDALSRWLAEGGTLPRRASHKQNKATEE
jgi:hypothetical protein